MQTLVYIDTVDLEALCERRAGFTPTKLALEGLVATIISIVTSCPIEAQAEYKSAIVRDEFPIVPALVQEWLDGHVRIARRAFSYVAPGSSLVDVKFKQRNTFEVCCD